MQLVMINQNPSQALAKSQMCEAPKIDPDQTDIHVQLIAQSQCTNNTVT